MRSSLRPRPRDATSLVRRTGLALAALAVTGSAGAAAVAPPWKRNPPLTATGGDARVVAREWRAAANRTTCAPLAFNTTRFIVPGARARRAAFSGGWAVAYDLPGRRSVFGLAGAGVEAEPRDITRWPNIRQWSDGSSAGWGLVGDTGPGHLAYLRVAGQRCLYNVWSDVSERHLRLLIAHLRRVRV